MSQDGNITENNCERIFIWKCVTVLFAQKHGVRVSTYYEPAMVHIMRGAPFTNMV